MTTILQGIGWFLLKIYEFFESCHIPASYALMLVVFTILIKVVIFPLSYKGKKSMMKMSMLQSKQKKLEQMYGNNRQKYQEEVQKLYEREHVNPMGGCLWSFLPLPILMALYVIIRRPMMYLMRIPDAAVNSAIEAVKNAGIAFTGNQGYHELQLAGMLKDSSVMDLVKNAIPDYADKLTAINFNFFGIDLSQVPSLKFWTRFDTLGVWGAIGLFLIPLAVTALNFWYTRYSMKSNQNLAESSEEQKKKKKKAKEEGKSSQERSNQMMMWMMPLMYLWFGYTMPAGMCIYMAANALCTVGQEAIFNKILRKDIDKMKAEAAEREEKEKAELAAHKAEIAERRRQEEANKANKGKKKAKKPASVRKPANKNGRIGIRTYALGRDYDPDRYGGVTAYRDPQEIIDEQAVEDAYKKKRRRKADAVEQALQQAEEAGDLEAVKKLEEKQAELAEAEEAAEEAAAELTETEVETAAADSAAENDGAETPAEEGSIADETFAQLNAETSAEDGTDADDKSSDDNA